MWNFPLVPIMGMNYIVFMNVIKKSALAKFWKDHNQAEKPLKAWHTAARRADWKTKDEIKAAFGDTVDFIDDNRAVFDISGNKYQLIVRISFKFKSMQVKFVGTHADYDQINAETV